MNKARDIRKTQKLAKGCELKARSTGETWRQQPYVALYSTSPQMGTQEVTFYHMCTVQVNSLND